MDFSLPDLWTFHYQICGLFITEFIWSFGVCPRKFLRLCPVCSPHPMPIGRFARASPLVMAGQQKCTVTRLYRRFTCVRTHGFIRRDSRTSVAHPLARRPLATSLREATCGRVIASGCLRQCTLRSEASAVHDATSPSSNRTCGFPAYGFPLSAFPVVMAFFLSWAVERILYDFSSPVNSVSAFLTLPFSCRFLCRTDSFHSVSSAELCLAHHVRFRLVLCS